ncbi:unnamed protein product [Larinioides sclopetarius]|uniref:Uncharacterized protein n=1 Tax=Larinioides sclopetarius TaxID=280406 RepID=A0AAV2B8N9_9ARAC
MVELWVLLPVIMHTSFGIDWTVLEDGDFGIITRYTAIAVIQMTQILRKVGCWVDFSNENGVMKVFVLSHRFIGNIIVKHDMNAFSLYINGFGHDVKKRILLQNKRPESIRIKTII